MSVATELNVAPNETHLSLLVEPLEGGAKFIEFPFVDIQYLKLGFIS
jgi:hypothetical protein